MLQEENGLTYEEYQNHAVELLKKIPLYTKQLIPALDTMADEVDHDRQEDTMAVLAVAIDSFDWILEVLAHSLPIVNEECERINLEKLNKLRRELTNALVFEDGETLARQIRISVTFLHKVETMILEMNLG